MDENKKEYRVVKMATVLSVNVNGYYKWQREGRPLENEKDKYVITAITKIQEKNKYRTGSPNVHEELVDHGIEIGHNKVARLMKENNLGCRTKKGYKVTTKADETKKESPDLLKRDFRAQAPNKKWVSDITYIRTASGWLYLCVVIDLFSRKVVGWSLSEKIDSALVCEAFEGAFASRGNPKGVIVHSDRGSQYTSDEFRKLLRKHKTVQSMSRKGDPWDNAVSESFFSTLKTEEVNRRRYRMKEEVELSLIEYIEIFYNRKRRHSFIDRYSPNDFEEKCLEKCA